MICIFFTLTSVIFNDLDSVKPSCSLSCHPVLNSFKIKIPSRESYFLGFEIYCEESCSQAVVRASKGHNYENHQMSEMKGHFETIIHTLYFSFTITYSSAIKFSAFLYSRVLLMILHKI